MLNADFTTNAPPIIINVNFSGAPAEVKGNAPNIHLIDRDHSSESDALNQKINFADPKSDYTATHANKILWNFVIPKDDRDSYPEVDVANDTMPGTILAPNSTISTGDAAHIFGGVIAQNINYVNGDIHRWDFNYKLWTDSNNKTVANRPQKNIHVIVKKHWSDLANENTAISKPKTVKVQLWKRTIDQTTGLEHFTVAENPRTKLTDPVMLSDHSKDDNNDWIYDFGELPTEDSNGNGVTYYAQEEVTDAISAAGYTATYDDDYEDDPDTAEYPNMTRLTITVSNAQHGFDITKLAKPSVGSETTSSKLTGAKYKVVWSTDNGKTWPGSLTDIATKDPSTVVPMEPGIYLIQESEAPAGFERDSTVYALKLTLANGETVANGWQKPTTDSTPHFNWQTHTFTDTSLEGVENDFENNSSTSNFWSDLRSSADAGLNPIGFSKPDGKVNLVHFTQEDTFKPLKVIKVDANDETKTLEGATFTIGQVGDALSYETNKDGQITDSSKKPALVAMEPDKVYQVTETKAPDGYEESKITVYLKNGALTNEKGDPLDRADIEKLPVDLNQGGDTGPLELKFKDKIASWSLNLKKLATDTGNPLSGAKFQLTPVTLSDAGSSSSATDATSSLTWADGASTDDQGLLPTQNGLKQHQVYRLTEIDAPAGYKPLSQPLYVKDGKLLNADGSDMSSDDQAALHIQISQDKTAETDPDSYTLTIKDEPRSILPHTGGPGDREYLVFALCMLGIAVCLTMITILRQREVNDHD